MVTESSGAINRVRIDDLADNTSYAKIDAELIHEGDRPQFVTLPLFWTAVDIALDSGVIDEDRTEERRG